MRRYAILLVAVVPFATVAPAQFYPAPGPGPRRSPPAVATTVSPSRSIGPGIAQVYSDINVGRSAGQLSHRQARQLRLEAGEINALERRYSVDGLSDAEAAELNNRIAALLSAINAERSGVIK